MEQQETTQPGSLERMVRADGHYDNTARMCRECWQDGRLKAFWTAESIQRGMYPNAPQWGTFPDVQGPNDKAQRLAANNQDV